MRFFLSIILTVALSLPLSTGFLALSATSAEAAKFGSSGFRSTSFRSTTTRMSSPRAYSYSPRSTTFRSVNQYRATPGSSNTMLYALAFMAIANSQANADDAPVRDPNNAATYGVSNPKTLNPLILLVFLLPFAPLLLLMFDFRPRRHSDYY